MDRSPGRFHSTVAVAAQFHTDWARISDINQLLENRIKVNLTLTKKQVRVSLLFHIFKVDIDDVPTVAADACINSNAFRNQRMADIQGQVEKRVGAS